MTKRNNAYYLQRLKIEHPEIHARLKRGEIASQRAAFILAGYRREPKGLDKLRAAWKGATQHERRTFLMEVDPDGKDEPKRRLTRLARAWGTCNAKELMWFLARLSPEVLEKARESATARRSYKDPPA